MKKFSSERYDIAIVGAGAAGLMAAVEIDGSKKKILIVERNHEVGRKLAITGKGRCNVTNNCTNDEFLSNVMKNSKFLYSAINTFSTKDTMNFFEKLGVKLKTERGNRVFPCSDKAYDIVDAMRKYMKKNGCILVHKTVTDVIYEDNIFLLYSEKEEIAKCSKLILACGGVSYPKTGSDGIGFKIAKSLGHTITDISPSLVPLVCSGNTFKILQGLSLKNVTFKIFDKNLNRYIFDDFGELIFTHFGLSGPVVLSASCHMTDPKKKRYRADIDLKPALSNEQIDKRLQREFSMYPNKNFENVLMNLLPRKMIPFVIKISEIDSEKKCNSITKVERVRLGKILKCISFDIIDFRPIEEAIITSGGISVKEINPKSMESKIIKGLYFAGEMIDVDAYTGGFNLQIAFSTGYLAGKSAFENKN